MSDDVPKIVHEWGTEENKLGVDESGRIFSQIDHETDGEEWWPCDELYPSDVAGKEILRLIRLIGEGT